MKCKIGSKFYFIFFGYVKLFNAVLGSESEKNDGK